MHRFSAILAVSATFAGSMFLIPAGCLGYLDADAGADAIAPDGPGPVSDARISDGGSTGTDGDAGLGAYAQAVIEAGAVVYLRFDEPRHSSIAQNIAPSSGRLCADGGTYPSAGATLQATGALVSDPTDTAVQVVNNGPEGSNNRITLDDCVDFGGTAGPPFSVEFWIQPDSVSAGYVGYVVDNSNWTCSMTSGNPSCHVGWDVIFEGSTVEGDLNAPNDTHTALYSSGSAAFTVSQWYYVVMVFTGSATGSEAQVFVNGVGGTIQHFSATLPQSDLGWSVGALNCECVSGGFSGVIDELAVYPTALSQQWIENHYALAGYSDGG